ncbi:unnamed protein product [Durusdinium trenchii]|uniref:Uncharacterized protein n=1 Tax=Durusdinium trenchii TaxID=1381693 RepID=A0ABP0IS70_9DINO
MSKCEQTSAVIGDGRSRDMIGDKMIGSSGEVIGGVIGSGMRALIGGKKRRRKTTQSDESGKCSRKLRRSALHFAANRRKLQHKEVQKQREEELREAKLRAEREQKEKERQEQQAAREQKILDAKEREAQRRQEEERLKRFMQQKREEEDAQAGFYGTRHLNMKGARGFKGGKAGKGVKKGDIQRQLREQEMERRAREVLANIGSTRSAEIGDRNSSDVERGVAGSTSKGDARNGGGDRVEESAAQPLSSGRETASDMKDGPVTLGGKNKDGKGKTVKKGGKKERKTDEARTSEKDRWWTKIDGDCPISLIPIAELPVPPFTLKASGSSVPHYFDARFLASFLLSSFDFMNPVNRSPLNREDCVALDVHLRQFYPDSSSSVTDAYDLFQRNGGNGSDAVRREATAVFQHLFRFQPRNLDSRGRAINYNDGALTATWQDRGPHEGAELSVLPCLCRIHHVPAVSVCFVVIRCIRIRVYDNQKTIFNIQSAWRWMSPAESTRDPFGTFDGLLHYSLVARKD